jgi:hypothetical protein
MLRTTFERMLRESYTELCRVTKAANDIERQAGELRARAAELSLRIHLVLGGLEEQTETRESRVLR